MCVTYKNMVTIFVVYHFLYLLYIYLLSLSIDKFEKLSKEELEGVFKMNEKIRDVDKMAEEVLRDRELWETINDKIMEKNLYNLKMQYAREQGEENGRIEGAKEKETEIAKKMHRDFHN